MACATFNFLNSEHRYVVGGIIPPAEMLSDFDQSFMSTEEILPESPYLKEAEDPGDLNREQMYIKGNLIPRMLGRDPTYDDPDLVETRKRREEVELANRKKQESDFEASEVTKENKQNKLENRDVETIEGEKKDPDKG